MEGLPGFHSLSTASCPPPASALGSPSIPYPRLTSSLSSAGTIVQATWTHSSPPSSLLASAPAAQEVKSNPCSRLCQIQRNITSPSLAQNALPATCLLTAACQPRGSFFPATKHTELIPAQSISQAAPLPSKLPFFFQLLLSICISAGRSRPSLTHPPATKHSSPRVSSLYGIYPDASFPLICI